MGTLGILFASLLVGFLLLSVGLQVLIRRRARALTGAPVPELPGTVGAHLARASSALVYFFSPSCAACRVLTPRVQELAKRRDGVFAVDVMSNQELARALSVMATPSTVEIRDGKIVGYHVGPVPADLWSRFA